MQVHFAQSYPKVILDPVHHQRLHSVHSSPQHHRDAELLKGKVVWYQETLCHERAVDPGKEAVLANLHVRLLRRKGTCKGGRKGDVR